MTQPVAVGPPRRQRPRLWWFGLGLAMILLGVAVFTVVLVATIRDFARVDADVVSDGQPHQVTLDHPDQERMIWGPSKDGTDCTITDRATGEEVTYSPVTASYDKTDNGTHYVGVVKFDPGSGMITVSCQDAGGPIQIGPAPHIGAFAGGIVVAVLALIVLLGGGLLVLVITLVLFVTGAPRQPRAA